MKYILKPSILQAILVTATLFYGSSCQSDSSDAKADADEDNKAFFKNDAAEKDAQFLVNAAETSLEEIQLALLAQQKSTRPIVQSLGKLMDAGHTKIMSEIITLAKAKSIKIPTSESNKAKEVYNNLNHKSGSYFDLEYCDLMVKGHQKAISRFEDFGKTSKDKEIKAWASATLIDLKAHLNHAIACQKKCNQF